MDLWKYRRKAAPSCPHAGLHVLRSPPAPAVGKASLTRGLNRITKKEHGMRNVWVDERKREEQGGIRKGKGMRETGREKGEEKGGKRELSGIPTRLPRYDQHEDI